MKPRAPARSGPARIPPQPSRQKRRPEWVPKAVRGVPPRARAAVVFVVGLLFILLILPALAHATTKVDPFNPPKTLAPNGQGAARPGSPVQDIDVVEHLGQKVDLDAPFVDSTGHTVKLRDYLVEGKPVVLSLVYYKCPMLCNLVLSGLTTVMRKAGLELGQDFKAITVSIDPKETIQDAESKRRGYVQSYGKAVSTQDWPFLVPGQGGQKSIGALAESVGFKYAYDSQTQQFAHAAVVFVLTPDGRISRYLYGMEFSPRDFKLSLVEASGGKVGTSFDRVLLSCYKYDPATRRYGFFVSNFIRAGGLAVFFALAAVLAVLWRRELKHRTV